MGALTKQSIIVSWALVGSQRGTNVPKLIKPIAIGYLEDKASPVKEFIFKGIMERKY